MSISSYEIELPINKECPYQQLYRGRHENNTIYILHIFPKQFLTQEMYEQIETRVKQLDHIQEVFDDESYVLVAYSNSTLWINLEQKFKCESMKSIYPKLYHAYARLPGILDFDQELVYLLDDQIYIIDYGLRQFVNKRHKDLEYTTKTKCYLFGLLILNLICGREMSEKLLQCQDQFTIDQVIHTAADTYKVNNEMLDYLLRMLKVDPTQRPTFEEIAQWKLFFKKKDVQPISASVVDFLNTKVGSLNSNRQQSRSARPQSQEIKELKDPHFQSVKAAIERQKRQIPSQSKVCSSYVFASTQVNNNMRRKRQEGGIVNGLQTQQSFFHYAQQSQFGTDNFSTQYPKTQNDFFAQQPKGREKQTNQPVGFDKQLKPNNTERKTPFLFDAQSPPPMINAKQQQQNTIIKDQHESQPQGASFFSNNQQNKVSIQATPSFQGSAITSQEQPSQQQLPIPSVLQKPVQQQPSIKQPVVQEKTNQHFKSQPSDNPTQQLTKLKTPPVSITRLEDHDIEEINVMQPAPQKTQIPTIEPKNELKKPINEAKILTKNQEKQEPKNQDISDIEEPQIIRPKKSAQPENKPVAVAVPPQPENLTHQFNEYITKYQSYQAIIQIITHAVTDINEKLSGSNQIWIVPLSVVFKRAYQIRKEFEEDVQKQRNCFGVKEFMKFKQSPQYKTLLDTIILQNQVMEDEFSSMLELALKSTAKLDAQSKNKMSALLNLDVSKCIKDQAEQYLFTQLYPRITSAINKLRTNTLPNNKYTEIDWLQTRLMALYAILVMELEQYTCQSELFKESTYLNYRKNQNIDQIEKHCNQIESKIKEIPKFKK